MAETPKMQIEYWAIDKLIPYARNPRKNDEAVPKMAGVIKEFGFKVPLVIKSDGEIIDGHLRLKAAQKLGMTEVPVVLADEWTPAQVKAFRLAVNRSAEWAEWDDELLKLELDDLKLEDFDLDLIGFDDYHIEDPAEGLTDPDDVPDVQETPVTRDGDIWLLGRHRLMCGDSTDAGSVALLMDGQHAKMLFTSPPYSDLRLYHGGNLETDHLANFIPVYKPHVDYQFVNLGIQIKDRALVLYWNDYIQKANDAGYKLMAWLVWDKLSAGNIGQQKHFIPTRHEFIFVFGEDAQKLNKTIPKQARSIGENRKKTKRNPDGTLEYHSVGDTSNTNKTIESVISLGSVATEGHKNIVHPAMFPVKLPAMFITAMMKENEIVIEPFCGSGTTIIAAEQNARRCYAMELSPQYVDCAVRRWQDFTGQDATLAGDGRTYAEIARERG